MEDAPPARAGAHWKMAKDFKTRHPERKGSGLLLDLSASGMLRETAYKTVQTHAMRCWEEEGDFRASIEADPEIGRHLAPAQIAESFSLTRQLSNVDTIFRRVFS